MKLALSLIAVALTGCAVPQDKPMMFNRSIVATSANTSVPIEALERIRLTNADCANMEQRIPYIERQLQMRGTWGHNPEELSEQDRRYNSAGKVLIWSLRIGCNNPNRYN
jgi:hypothetical protein